MLKIPARMKAVEWVSHSSMERCSGRNARTSQKQQEADGELGTLSDGRLVWRGRSSLPDVQERRRHEDGRVVVQQLECGLQVDCG